ncbi:hypothetical protein FXN63_21365 [Pigmentiphaga aceris]|uniref:Uncharacterized protein n=1 Tax=Pigmentiphaga aceris TaxID=1940612 RepID=A0A5C0B2G0_9BURK|nr:hypothetical protein [Pigmentiphaga aceris]QEI08106.1 hypothetical protein FXN63_21365 [Pigmentiphaga aceris]
MSLIDLIHPETVAALHQDVFRVFTRSFCVNVYHVYRCTDFLGIWTGLRAAFLSGSRFFFMVRSSTFLSAPLSNGRPALAPGVRVSIWRQEPVVSKQPGILAKNPVFFSVAGSPSASPASPFVVTSRRVSPAWRNAAGSAGHLADRSGFFTAFP